MNHFNRLSIIIPVYNEARTVHYVLDRVEKVVLIGNIQKEIIIVNDGSSDNTHQVISDYLAGKSDHNIHYYIHEKNNGKGAAIQTGVQNASGEYFVVQDADLEYDPDEYNLLIKPVLDGHADVVYGSRFTGGNARRMLFFWHSVGNRFLTFLSNVFTNLNLSDMETGFKLFPTKVLRQIKLKEKRFGFEPEVTAKISRVPGIRIYEVGISYYGRTYNDGKKINWKDGIRAIYSIMKYNILDKK